MARITQIAKSKASPFLSYLCYPCHPWFESAASPRRDFIVSRHYPPTMQELGDLLGVTAASIHQHVNILERKGYVSREHRKARSLAILREPEQELETLVPVPMLGRVNAGPTLFAEEHHEGDVLIDKSIAGRGRCFALRISGASMIGAGMRKTPSEVQ